MGWDQRASDESGTNAGGWEVLQAKEAQLVPASGRPESSFNMSWAAGLEEALECGCKARWATS